MGQDQSTPISGVALHDEPVNASSAPNKREALDRAAVLKQFTVARPFVSDLHKRSELKGHHDRPLSAVEQIFGAGLEEPPTKKLRQANFLGGNVAGNANEEWDAVRAERAHPAHMPHIFTKRGPDLIEPADAGALGALEAWWSHYQNQTGIDGGRRYDTVGGSGM